MCCDWLCLDQMLSKVESTNWPEALTFDIECVNLANCLEYIHFS